MNETETVDYTEVNRVVADCLGRYGLRVDRTEREADNPYLITIHVTGSAGRATVRKAFNEIFHALGLLPPKESLPIGECSDYCGIYDNVYSAIFNHPAALSFAKDSEDYKFTFIGMRTAWEDGPAEKAARERARKIALVEALREGRIRSKKSEASLVMIGDYYDAIDEGRKTVEFRDFTEYNLKRTIGIKTVCFRRGYRSGAKRMRWEVAKVTLMDEYYAECDPFDVPDGFLPEKIAIHLGKRSEEVFRYVTMGIPPPPKSWPRR